MTSASLQRVGFGPSARGLIVLLVAVAAVGCKSGSSWTAKPSWWTFGGSGDDPAKLAAAPPATTDTTKPSAAHTPYPTTTTPEGYVMENAQRAGQTQVASASQPTTAPAAEPPAVTYGSKPPVSATPSPPPQMAAASAGGGTLSGIAPQVGPYGAPPGTSPLEQTLPPSTTPASSFGAAPPAAAEAGVRVADARGAESWSPAPPAASAAPPATSAAGDSRYGASVGSRFSGAAQPMNPPMTQPAPASAFPPITPAAPATLPASIDPLAAPAAGPATAPSSLAPPTPTRRADPGYRPGGTSSYRPSRTILAGDATAEPGAIQPVSFEMPVTESP